ncbi:MAG: LptF/LptG family permease [Thermoguttaceae bacterium]
MSIIDRYMLRQFIRTFLICYLSLTGLYIVFDAFTNLEEFLRVADKSGGLASLMVSHYTCRSVLFFDRTSGLLALVSAMFTVAWIQRHNELTALMAAGISRVRVIKPIIIAAIVVSLLSVACRELLIPRFRKELARRTIDLVGDIGQDMGPRYDNKTVILFGGKSTFGDRQLIREPNFRLPPSLSHYGRELIAENAFYKAPEGGRPGGYLMDGVRQPRGLHSRPSLKLDGRPVIITPLDEPDWLDKDQCFVVSDVDFEQLTGGAGSSYASTAQLISGLQNRSLDFGADVRVMIHSRMVQPLLDVTLLFLGLPLVVSRTSRNVFVAIGMCVGVVTVFLLVVIGLQALGTDYLINPALAAWAPLMIFVPLAVASAISMRD